MGRSGVRKSRLRSFYVFVLDLVFEIYDRICRTNFFLSVLAQYDLLHAIKTLAFHKYSCLHKTSNGKVVSRFQSFA